MLCLLQTPWNFVSSIFWIRISPAALSCWMPLRSLSVSTELHWSVQLVRILLVVFWSFINADLFDSLHNLRPVKRLYTMECDDWMSVWLAGLKYIRISRVWHWHRTIGHACCLSAMNITFTNANCGELTSFFPCQNAHKSCIANINFYRFGLPVRRWIICMCLVFSCSYV